MRRRGGPPLPRPFSESGSLPPFHNPHARRLWKSENPQHLCCSNYMQQLCNGEREFVGARPRIGSQIPQQLTTRRCRGATRASGRWLTLSAPQRHGCLFTEEAMPVETKFLRLRQPVELVRRIDGWRVCWLGGWDRHG